MDLDVRNKPSLTAEDVLRLNFIREAVRYDFRRHYRQGLRSHIMEVLDPEEVAREKSGVVSDGIKWFPRARPLKMLRIFRTRFASRSEAHAELRRVVIVASYLGAEGFARSNEFLVTYLCEGHQDILLCGLQEYVEGLNIEPWGFLNAGRLADNLLRPRLGSRATPVLGREALVARIRRSAELFTDRIKQMVRETGYIPDLAGDGNLILTDAGEIKLVDINNISPVAFDSQIYIDDKGYPVCDKSFEALAEIEKNLASRPLDTTDPVYRTFLDSERMLAVGTIEREFHRAAAGPQPYRPD
ncbi:MAG: hypothetical protein WCD88_06155 [Desulfobacterales bacterium]